MRVMAARPAGLAAGSERQIGPAVLGALSLALLDPGMAETALKQIEARLGSGPSNPTKLSGSRGPWFSAWALVDIKKAGTLFEAELALAAAPGTDNPDALIQGLLTTAKLLATLPGRRETALQDGLYAGSWRPARGRTRNNSRSKGEYALGPDHGAVAAARGAPAIVEARALRHRILGGKLLVDVDAQARCLIRVHVAILDRRGSRGRLPVFRAETRCLRECRSCGWQARAPARRRDPPASSRRVRATRS